MAHDEQHLDLVTLEEVHRLLADTKFASIDDLAGGAGLGDLAGALDSGRAAITVPPPAEPGALPPLPRRR